MSSRLAVAALMACAVLGWPASPGVARLPRRSATVPSRTASRRHVTGVSIGYAHLRAEDLWGLLDLTSAQVRAGAAPSLAWVAALEVMVPGAVGRSAAQVDPAGWLSAVAAATQPSPVSSAAASLAAAWRLALRTGAPLAELLDSVGRTLRAEVAARAAVEAALAGPRATARLLVGLPLAGTALGVLIGAQPVRVLVGTGAGRVCGAVGLVLLLLGHWWMRRLVGAASLADAP